MREVPNEVRRDVVVNLDIKEDNVKTVERTVEKNININAVMEKNVEYIVQ